MSRYALIASARARTEAQFGDTCTSRRQTGTTYDANDNPTPVWTALYSGPCRMRQPNAEASSNNVGEAAVLLQQPEVHLPMSADVLRPGDEITITGSVSDSSSIGRVFRVRSVPAHSDATARRYGVTERTS